MRENENELQRETGEKVAHVRSLKWLCTQPGWISVSVSALLKDLALPFIEPLKAAEMITKHNTPFYHSSCDIYKMHFR